MISFVWGTVLGFIVGVGVMIVLMVIVAVGEMKKQ